MRDKCCHSVPYFAEFKLALTGLLIALILALASITPAFKHLTVGVPTALLASVLVALPSAALYFKVRDKFWSEVYKKFKVKTIKKKEPGKTLKDPLALAVIATTLLALAFTANIAFNEKPGKNTGIPSYTEEDVFIDLKISDLVPKRLVILKDGALLYTEGEVTEVTYLSEEQLAHLRQTIIDKHFYLMHKEYQGGCNNCVAHNLWINLHGNVHSIYCYFQCPDEFYEITEEIKAMWPKPIEYIGFD